jgi:hypothetical protein
MNPHLLTAIGSLLGVVIGIVGSFSIAWLRSRVEERKHKRQLVFSAATENFRQACESMRSKGGQVPPFEEFLVHMLILSDIVTGNRVDDALVVSAMQRFRKVREIMRENYL